MTAGLIALKRLVPVSWGIEGIPADKDRAGLFALKEPEQKVGETDNCACTFISGASNGFRHGVVGAMGKRVAVNDE